MCKTPLLVIFSKELNLEKGTKIEHSEKPPWVRSVNYWKSVHILTCYVSSSQPSQLTSPSCTARDISRRSPVSSTTQLQWLHTNYYFPLFELYTVKMAISVSICKGKRHTHCTDYWLSCAHCHFAPHFPPSTKLVTLPVLITGHTNFCCVAKWLLYLKRNVLPFISVSIPCSGNYNIPRPRSLFTNKRSHNKNMHLI